MTDAELKHAKETLKKLKAKVDSVDPKDLVGKSGSFKENFFYCQKQQILLSGQLENSELEAIATQLKGQQASFKEGIKNLNDTINRVEDGVAFLGILDQVVSIIARIATILR